MTTRKGHKRRAQKQSVLYSGPRKTESPHIMRDFLGGTSRGGFNQASRERGGGGKGREKKRTGGQVTL